MENWDRQGWIFMIMITGIVGIRKRPLNCLGGSGKRSHPNKFERRF